MNTDSVTKFQMLSKVAVLLEELHRHEMNPQKLLFSGSSSCEHTWRSWGKSVPIYLDVWNMNSSKEDHLKNKPLDKLPEPEPTPETKVL